MTIKELRKQQNLSQAAFAERIGVKAATVSQLENGRMKVIWWVRPDGETGAVEIWNDRA